MANDGSNNSGLPEMDFTCECGATVKTAPPYMDVTAKPPYTAIIFLHPGAIRCPQCERPFMFAFKGFKGLSWELVPVKLPDTKPKLWVPGQKL